MAKNARFAFAIFAVVGGCLVHHAVSQLKGKNDKPTDDSRRQKKSKRPRKCAAPATGHQSAAAAAAAAVQDSTAPSTTPPPSKPAMDTTNNKTNPVIIVAEACSEVFTAPSTPTKASTPLMATPTINTWSTKLFPASLWWPYRAELVAAAFLVAFAAIGAVLVHHHLPWGVLAIIVATMPVAAKLDAWRFDISYGLPDPSAARAAQPQPEGSAEKVADAKQAALLAPGAVTAA